MSAQASPSGQWSGSGKMRGGRWGVWFFITVLRLFGLSVTRALVAPTAVVCAFISPDVSATMDFHRRVWGPQPRWKRRWLVFKHFRSFGRAMVDRTAILAGKTKLFSFTFDGENHLHDALAEGRGVVLLTAHFGNWEAAGSLLSRLDVPINVTGFDHESTAVRSLLKHASKAKFRHVPLSGSPTDVIPLMAALRRGEIVAMLGDRAYGSSSTEVPFLGGTASFPIGAYVMASIADAPLVHVFSLSEPQRHYRLFAFPPQRPKMPRSAERGEYLQACAMHFAGHLESMVKRDPLQWYNFFPFWQKSTATEPAAPSHSENKGARPSTRVKEAGK